MVQNQMMIFLLRTILQTRLSSTKDDRERQGSVVVSDDISSVYDRYRVVAKKE